MSRTVHIHHYLTTLLILISLILQSASASEISIDSVTILLPHHVPTPYRTFVVYYPVSARIRTPTIAAGGNAANGAATSEGYTGCFEWRASHPDLIQIQPVASTKCAETVLHRNPVTGHQEWKRKEGYTSVYVSATTNNLQSTAAANGAEEIIDGENSVTATRRRLSSWISAHDITREDRVAECEIFIDTIARLEILTSTRRINVGDVEALQLAAYDSMDNVFSSLDGLPFKWTNTDSNILKEISLVESGLVVSEAILELERSEVQTNIHPVRGSIPGRVNMSVSLADSTHPISTSAEFLVIEPLFLRPSSVRLCPGSELRVQLMTRFKEERVVHTDRTDDAQSDPAPTSTSGTGLTVHRREIPMPSTQYKWSSLAPTIVSIDKDTGVLVARRTGSTHVRVGDVNVAEHRRDCDVIVVEPASIVLELKPLNLPAGVVAHAKRVQCDGQYYVAEGQSYELLIYLLDAAGLKIAITPNMQFDFSVQGVSMTRTQKQDTTPTSPLPSQTAGATPPTSSTIQTTPSSSSIHLLAATRGLTSITVSLSKVESTVGNIAYTLVRDGKPQPLTSTTRIMVTPPVKIQGPSPLRLPFVSPTTPRYPLQAIGGSGQYSWRSKNHELVQVDMVSKNATVTVDILPQTMGETQVQVTDACNPESAMDLDVHITQPIKLEFIEIPQTVNEAILDPASPHHDIDVYVRVRAGHNGAWDDCSALYLHASFVHGAGVFQLMANTTQSHIFQCHTSCPIEVGSNCFVLRLVAAKAGLAQLRVNLVDSPSIHGVPLPSQPAFNVYSVFTPLSVGPSPLLLASGSSQEIEYVGGPIAWSRRGFVEEEGHGVPISSGASVDQAHYDHLIETSFIANYIHDQIPFNSSNVFDQHELVHASFHKHDITSEGFVRVQPKEGRPNQFILTCQRASEVPIAVHVLVSNNKEFNSNINPLHNPLTAHAIVRVHCFPPLQLAKQPVSLGIGESKQLQLENPSYILAKFVRFDPEGAETSHILRVNHLTGVVTGLRLGQGYVRAFVDREALLVELGYDLAATQQPVYQEDGLTTLHFLRIEFDSFRIELSHPYATNTLLRQHSTLATVVGGLVEGPNPLDESFEHVQCAWTVESTSSSAASGLLLAPILSSTFHTPTDEPTATVYGCAIRVHASKGGVHQLRVRIHVSVPPTSSGRASATAPTTEGDFESTLSIQVIEPLLLLSSSQLILPPGSSATILTNIQSHGVQSNATAASVSYSVLAPEGATAPLVSVDERGLITVPSFANASSHQVATDAVVLVQYVHDPSSSSVAANASVSPVTQSAVVLVSVRPIAQLFVVASGGGIGSTGGPQLLCSSRNYSFAVGVLDPLGRRFDVTRVDELLGSELVVTSSTSGRGELPIIVHTGPTIQVNEQVLNQVMIHVGDAPSDLVTETHHAAQSLHALQDFMLQVSVPGSSLTPLFVQFYVAPTHMCTEPAPVLLSMKLSLTPKTWKNEYPSNSVHRDEFTAALVRDLAASLNFSLVDQIRIKVVNVDVSTNLVEVLILPKSYSSNLHHDQWFMTYFTPGTGNTLLPTEAWLSAPLTIAQELQRQATDRSKSSRLWSGAISHFIDPKAPFSSVELPASEAERLIRERRGPSSTLSTAAASTTLSSSQSPWSDEREYATWSRVLDGSRETLASSRKETASTETTSSEGVSHGGHHEGESVVAGSEQQQQVASTPAPISIERQEEELKWKELKRRYELEKLRELSPESFSSSVLGIFVYTLLTLLALLIGGSYLYWYTFIAYLSTTPASRARPNLPADQLRFLPDHNYFIWAFYLVRDYCCCCYRQRRMLPRPGVGGIDPAALIDPSLQPHPSVGPNDFSWQQQQRFQQVPAAQVFIPNVVDDFQHIPHAWERS